MEDQQIIRSLIENHEYYHHHLDWQPPAGWLGCQPFLILNSNGMDAAALACPPRPQGISWIRMFVTLKAIPVELAWRALLGETLLQAAGTGVEKLVGLGFSSWFSGLLEDSGFSHFQDVVGLETLRFDSSADALPGGYTVRGALETDLPSIAALDARAFDRIWQHPLPTMKEAFRNAGYVSVILNDGEIVGYQLSTCAEDCAHLARLSVDPIFQNRGFGRRLIQDLFQYCKNHRIQQVTVNTQSDNQASLALYQSLGFDLTGERYPVYILHSPSV